MTQQQKKTGKAPANPKPLITEAMRQFALAVQTARILWRAHPELIEAAKLPAHLTEALEDVEVGTSKDASCKCYHCPCGGKGTLAA